MLKSQTQVGPPGYFQAIGNRLSLARLLSGIFTIAAMSALAFSVADASAEDSGIIESGFIDIEEFLALEVVFVTAQRRDEKLQDVPISVTALQGNRLDAMFQGGEDI